MPNFITNEKNRKLIMLITIVCFVGGAMIFIISYDITPKEMRGVKTITNEVFDCHIKIVTARNSKQVVFQMYLAQEKIKLNKVVTILESQRLINICNSGLPLSVDYKVVKTILRPQLSYKIIELRGG